MTQYKISSSVKNYVAELLEQYCNLRGNAVDPSSAAFWDVIVVSASDKEQQLSYEEQITFKNERNELPISIPIHVFADPAGYKIGCGGSALFVLSELSKIYGASLFDLRVLLIPAGGYSQRLPNLSVLGKLFSLLPFGDRNFQMFDLILATYLPFLRRMRPGVFIASSDAIISYNLSMEDSWTFEGDGFTALAHHSSLQVGTSHGVYVLPESEAVSEEGSAFMSECLQVLQKPTIEKMREKGAVKVHKTGTGNTTEMVYSDSAFFFDHSISQKLIKFYKAHQPIKCELSSYGDFLQPLGANASPSYILDGTSDEDLALLQSAIYRNLFGTNLFVLVLKDSYFHHLGTMQEYIDSLCGENIFTSLFPVNKFTCSKSTILSIPPCFISGTVVNSLLHPLSIVPKCTVIEYCDLNIAVEVGDNCIISNVQLDGLPVQRLQHSIPAGSLFHTMPVKSGYVTLAFGVDDDVKKSHGKDSASEVKFFGRKVREFVRRECLKDLFDPDHEEVCLWSARFFPVCETMQDSFLQTLRIVWGVLFCDEMYSNFQTTDVIMKFVSAKDALLLKDASKLLRYQLDLMRKIKQLESL